jgi:hypothetical protein
MLGETIGQSKGKVTGQRVLPGDDYRYVKIEVTIQETGTLLGLEITNAGTYLTLERVPGQLYGEGQGLVMASNGESAIWNGHGVGRATGEGMAMSFRYSIAFQAPTEGKLARLNSVLIVGEHDIDAEGNTHTTMTEWK